MNYYDKILNLRYEVLGRSKVHGMHGSTMYVVARDVHGKLYLFTEQDFNSCRNEQVYFLNPLISITFLVLQILVALLVAYVSHAVWGTPYLGSSLILFLLLVLFSLKERQ